ncbi:BCN_G0029580.mRNA.1.CDS.1 [Saccharomyces cerevisiae]|nr:BCN_G0029580.mRNA.1.CDS.1 [Saccharomyces cerevisiae]CAI4558418.1 BCE_3a_G0029480.mRNA.1.CDS.1 [Saccharomyces cerevisiae]CAI5277602.1 ALI_HP2_G0023640.mRNA.1.CDS.1 [Saccharomyces cerevisiae]CAI6534778.1 ALI_HP2_G0023640.mRNA.1.CDS.1 [Saccharomyces cerevisiae]CAI6594572.1 ALI_HP1_G0029930.mRNA.1.CDS.1 [Saccharomyces cerevisiae]
MPHSEKLKPKKEKVFFFLPRKFNLPTGVPIGARKRSLGITAVRTYSGAGVGTQSGIPKVLWYKTPYLKHRTNLTRGSFIHNTPSCTPWN